MDSFLFVQHNKTRSIISIYRFKFIIANYPYLPVSAAYVKGKDNPNELPKPSIGIERSKVTLKVQPVVLINLLFLDNILFPNG